MLKIIAECGCNWKSLDEAKLMIAKSKEVGCWASKFQLFSEKEIQGSPYHNFLRTIILTHEKAKELFEYGKSIGQEVFFTPMYLEAVDICEKIGISYYKIRFKDNQNHKLQWKIVRTNKPFFISFMPFGGRGMIWKQAIILNCVPEYPAPLQKYLKWDNLLYIHGQGISDHTSDLELLKNTMNNKFVRLYEEKNYSYYFEKHVKLDDNCLESRWSVLFDDLEKVLK